MKGHPSFCTMRLTNAAAALGRQELLLVSRPDTGYISIPLLLASGYCFFQKTMCPIAVTPAAAMFRTACCGCCREQIFCDETFCSKFI